jgi:Membrane carboxypeptidase (penicillin-binding protein)
MKILKKLIKFASFCLIIMTLGYFCLYTYARYATKLVIENANEYLIYDNNELLVDDLSDNWVSLNSISENVINATIAIEDKKFYGHSGFDYLRIMKSLYINISSGENKQGASTISQQLAKNLFLTFDKTWERKIKEAWLTIQLETQYDKDQILEAYLNTINYGGIYGIENASKYYFHKSANNLSLAEATILVGIPKSPTNYSPIINEENAKRRQLLILNTMVNQGIITEDIKDSAYNEQLTYYGTPEEHELKTLMYYQDAVMKELETIDDIPTTLLEAGGLKIYTYLDLEAQTILEKSMDKNITNDSIQISAIMMEPETGHIIALTGGRNYSTSQYNRAITSKRQVGSTMKPFLYYAALENGFTESTTFTSEKTTFVFSENKTYSPSNYKERYGEKAITMAAALAYSDNIYAVKTHIFLGENTLVDLSKRIGITTNLQAVPSLALGSGEISLYEMVNAYSTFANEGYKVKGSLIKRVEDMDGNILYENKEEKEAVLNSSLVYILNEALTSTYNYNFIDYNYPTCYDITSSLTHKYSIKTGTTNSDHLIFGYNKNIVVGIWSGNDDGSDSDVSNGKELRYMWRDIVEGYLANKEVDWYTIPDNVVGTLVNPISGEIANNKTAKATMFYYIKGTEPTYKKTELDDLIPTIKSD